MKKEIFKFLVTGGICTALNYSVFYILLTALNANYLISSGTGYISGVVLGYYINRNWTFRVKEDNVFMKVKYLLIYTLNMLIGLVFLKALTELLGINPKLGNILVIGYTTVANFIGIKLFVFRKIQAYEKN